METDFEKVASDEQPGSRWLLSSLTWHVWFLGYGLGGCTGLALIAGLWSIAVDATWLSGVIALLISGTHAALLCFMWSRRAGISAWIAICLVFLMGSAGIATVALVLTSTKSLVPSVNSLYILAFMNFLLAFTMPLQARLSYGPAAGAQTAARVG